MPFRKNFFGDQHPQPGTEWSEIEDMLADRFDIFEATPTYAEVYGNDDPDEESLLKKGGYFIASGKDDEGEFREQQIDFDGFESIEAIQAWLVEIGVPADQIEVTN